MSELDSKLRAVGAMWGRADYERIAVRLAPIHERVVTALDPQPGEHWLDLATGTGEVALRAARRGALVTGIDISEQLLELARAKAEAEFKAHERYRANGTVRLPREYLLVLGRRR